MKKLTLTIILAVVALSAAAQDFDKLFDNFAMQADADYQAFRDDANKAFVELLKESWVEFKVLEGQEYPKKPKPETAPLAPVQQDGEAPEQAEQESPQTETPEQTPEFQQVPDSMQAPHIPAPQVPQPPSPDPVKGAKSCSLAFYGSHSDFLIPEVIADFKMSGNSENDVAKFWDSLSAADYRSVLSQINEHASSLQLEGWSLFLLIDRLAGEVYGPSRTDESEVFKIFIMNQLGMDARLGLADGRLTANVCVKEQVYASLFYQYQGRKYYFSPSVRQVAQFKSYPGQFSDEMAPLSVQINRPLNIGNANSVSLISRYSKVFGTEIQVPVNNARCDFYLDFPQVDVDIYAKAACDADFTASLVRTLRPLLEGKDELTQVNLLLRFLQYDFDYKTDDEQFGYEKPFFPEENFIYPCNDCEDRSILFSQLVRNILGLDVVLVDYPDHIAAAVLFHSDIAGDCLIYEGQRYTICDPTYIGAPAGMAMADYRGVEFKVLAL